MKGTMLRYRTKTNMHSRQIMRWASPQIANSATTVCAAAEGNVSRGIPSAELATM